jgi:transposase
MTKMTDDTIGIDISKATLDIHRLSDGKMMSFSNCPAGFKALSKFCAQTAVTRVVYEATDAYHSGLERALGAHLPLVKVNPLQARRFAQAQGVRAKTDAVPSRRCKHRLSGNGRKNVGRHGQCFCISAG